MIGSEWAYILPIAGIVGNAAIVWYRTSEMDHRIAEQEKRLSDAERWQSGADKVLGGHEKRLDNLEDS